MSLNIHRFAAIKGRQSGDDYYTVICEMALIPKLFLFNESTIPTELRAQRHINKGRIPEIARELAKQRQEEIRPPHLSETYIISHMRCEMHTIYTHWVYTGCVSQTW